MPKIVAKDLTIMYFQQKRGSYDSDYKFGTLLSIILYSFLSLSAYFYPRKAFICHWAKSASLMLPLYSLFWVLVVLHFALVLQLKSVRFNSFFHIIYSDHSSTPFSLFRSFQPPHLFNSMPSFLLLKKNKQIKDIDKSKTIEKQNNRTRG